MLDIIMKSDISSDTSDFNNHISS